MQARRFGASIVVASMLLAAGLVAAGPAAGDVGDVIRISRGIGGAVPDSGSDWPSVSGDGEVVAFSSNASNLVSGDTNFDDDVFVYEVSSGVMTRVSVSSSGDEGSGGPSYSGIVSADGRYVAFASDSYLVPDDMNGETDLYVHDRTTGITSRESVDSNGGEGNDNASDESEPVISSDGRYVGFSTDSTTLLDGGVDGLSQAYVRDRITGTTDMISHTGAGVEGNGPSWISDVSDDGMIATFVSEADNLVPGDSNAHGDVFVLDRSTDTLEIASVTPAGGPADARTYGGKLTPNGRFVVMTSQATNLVAGDTNGAADVFIRDLTTGVTERVSVSSNGSQANGASTRVDVSANGRYVVFESEASNLVSGDTNGAVDVFVRDRVAQTTRRVSVTSMGAQLASGSFGADISADGRFVVYATDADEVVPGDTDGQRDVFRYQLLPDPPPVAETTTTTTPTTTSSTSSQGGRFVDDDDSEFEDDIEAIAAAGITRGCNPPVNDRFCPTDPVTRGQMAAFLARGLDLAPSGLDRFVDDDSSVFEADIQALALAGITRGCNPPANDRFCPTDPVTRGQMAAFLVRGLGLAPSNVDRFVDDDTSIFEDDIQSLAVAGITRGCNPPLNDRYCPADVVTRGQMAAFLNRALLE